MKKMSRIVIGFIFGILVAFTLDVAAETLINSGGVSYSNSRTNETTVSGALDELFSAVDINEEINQLKEEINSLKTSTNITSVMDAVYPVGSIYISENNQNPSNLFGGTWERYGVGRTLVSTDGTSGQIGGSLTATLSINNLPSHNHSIPALSGTAASTGNGYSITYGASSRITSTNGNHSHYLRESTAGIAIGSSNTMIHGDNPVSGSAIGLTGGWGSVIAGIAGDHAHDVSDYYATSISGVESHKHSVTTVANTTGETGSGASFSVQDPYITVYMWKRTA